LNVTFHASKRELKNKTLSNGYRIPPRRFCAISTPKTISVAITRNQNKAIGSINPPNKKTSGSFFQRKNTRLVLIICKGQVIGLL
jgi:hypothetical protein